MGVSPVLVKTELLDKSRKYLTAPADVLHGDYFISRGACGPPYKPICDTVPSVL